MRKLAIWYMAREITCQCTPCDVSNRFRIRVDMQIRFANAVWASRFFTYGRQIFLNLFYLDKYKPARFLVFIYFSVLITSSYKFNECLYPTLHSFRIQRPALRRPRPSAPQYQQTLPVLTLVAPGFHLASTHDAGKLLPTWALLD